MLKIVQGPNAGAEIALVDGLCITLGRSDSCDIVLADSLLPAEPVQLETQSDGVAMTAPGEGRVHLKPYHVVTIGATSFAVGPADGPWEPLVWPEAEKTPPAEKPAESEPAEPPPPAGESKTDEEPPKKGCGLGCALAVLVVLAILLLLAWLLFRFVGRDEISSRFDEWVSKAKEVCSCSSGGGDAKAAKEQPPKVTLESLVRQYALVETNVNGRSVLRGNFRTRAERLAAAGGIYALKPGADLDFSDDESFRSAAEDLIFTLTEGSLKVVAATNRVLALSGTSPSVVVLKKTLRAVAADLPRLENVDCSAVRLGDCVSAKREEESIVDVGAVTEDWVKARESRPAAAVARKTGTFNPPLCGILTTPYPCLVMRDGTRVMEGAALGGNVILKIDADSVTVTNSMGRFIWRP